jgi:hydrogenase maturation protease
MCYDKVQARGMCYDWLDTMPQTLVIGLGNDFRGDDGAGLVVARRLRELALPGVIVLEQSGEGAALVEAWGAADRVIVVDAVSSGSEPGLIHRIEVNDQPLPAHLSRGSSHAFGLAEAVALARQLDRLPASMTIYGIEGQSFAPGTDLSPQVQAAVETIIEQLAQEPGSL